MPHTGSIEDQLAIRGLVESYGDAVAQRDAAQWGACWTAEATWAVLGQEFRGRDAIVAQWQAMMDSFAFAAFSMSIGRITVDGDRATLRVYASEELWGKDDSLTRIKGQYDDILVRTPAGWLFEQRTYTVLKMH